MSQASLQENKLNEILLEEDMQLIQLLEKAEKSNAKKNKLKKKEPKHHKSGDSPEADIKNLPPCREEERDSSAFSESSLRTSSSRKKKMAAGDENCPPQEGKEGGHTHHIPDPMESPVKEKSKKKKKSQGKSLESSPSKIAVDALRRSAAETKSNRVDTPTDPKRKMTSRSDGGTRKHPLSLRQSSVIPYSSTPHSSPKRATKLNGKGEDENGPSDQSQDLFLTQQKFVSSHCSSEDSPPLGQEQGDGLREWPRSRPPHYGMQLLSQLSCLRHNSAERSSSGSSRHVALKENATQTEEAFTYLALMSLIKKVKVLEPCSEKALDLSLPSRIRAEGSAQSSADDIIVVESQSTPVEASRKKSINFCFSPLQKPDETKFIQTVLNSSYFFKGKGEPGEGVPPIAPLIKGKEKPKKRQRRPGTRPKKEAKAT